MPVSPTYPGVYIEELPSGVRTIVGVSTSVAAFIDFFRRGPFNRAVRVFNFGDVEREFGGLHRNSEASYALRQFFLNGGTQAYVVRTASPDSTPTNPTASAIDVLDAPGGGASFTATAGRRMGRDTIDDPGTWGDNIRLDVDHDTSDPASTFNLAVSEIEMRDNRMATLRSETYRNLSMTNTDPDYAEEVVNSASKMVQLSALGATRPAQTGTTGAFVNMAAAVAAVADGDQFSVTGGAAVVNATLDLPAVFDFATLRAAAQAAIRAAAPADPLLAQAIVVTQANPANAAEARLRILAGRSGRNFDPDAILTCADVTGTPATDLGIATGLAGVIENVQMYSLGGTATGAQTTPVPGVDGDPPAAADILGNRLLKTGMYALEDVDLFNILCIPRMGDLDGTNMVSTNLQTVVAEAEAYCLERRAFLIVDIPPHVNEMQDALDWLDQNPIRHRNAAVYFPRPRIPDILNNNRQRSVGASGTIAGLYARIDGTRGVWKAPAGTEAVLNGVPQLDALLTDAENGALNPMGINCLRTFDVYGNVCWGARTLDGADVQASEWKYIPIRRLALYIEESLYRGTKWVVFEPNDEPLWAQIRLNVGAFMHNLFRKGAFQGSTSREAYFVKCDAETTTQADRNLGIVNILVGFAPLKPAEFVIIQIQQIAGEIET